MLKSLVKIANKLDSLGLTKEADVIDREIIRLAQMDGMASDASSRVRSAIEASIGMPHFEGAFRRRNPSKESEGSTFIEAQTPDSLMNANWSEYNHPDVKAPAVAFRADIPGYFGIIGLSEIDPETPVEIVKSQKGALREAVCIIPASSASRSEEDFTTILLGPGGDKEIVWTFFPGPPIAPSSIPWTQELADSVTTVGDALDAGFEHGELGGS
jgi:hypothetical protein